VHERKDASLFTSEMNTSMRASADLEWDDRLDWEEARRGFIARLDEPVIRDQAGKAVWDLEQYAFLEEEEAPPTVNPSLWRQARLNLVHGLFEVTDRIYQVRGHDLSVITFIEGDSGYIVIDPLISEETARASLELVYRHLGEKPVVAVIYTHSHVDHWGGVKGVVSEAAVRAGEARIIAPEGFTEAAILENLFAGNAMARRASYMYGNLLPKDPKGQVDAGLGKTTSSGRLTLIEPTLSIVETGTEMEIDGVPIVFQVTPDTEAPAEMNFHFPLFNALCMAENCTHNMHNLYTLRGAAVRDSRAWARYIDEAIELFGDKTDMVFASHHWPTWGRERCLAFMSKQRDMYKYLHDQTLRLANKGYTMLEIAETVSLPAGLAKAWYNRGYYGTVNHDVKAVYQKYLGFFDGNPANLHPLPPEEAAVKYVEFMGGAAAVIERARRSLEAGEYRWTAQVLNHVVFAEPGNEEARDLQAVALEQLGYQSESGPWRNFYLSGAQELREGVHELGSPHTMSEDVLAAMSLDHLFDYMAIRLDAEKAAGKTIVIDFQFTDTGQRYVLKVENAVLNHSSGRQDGHADASVVTTRSALNEFLVAAEGSEDASGAAGAFQIEGDPQKIAELFSLLDRFDFWFNIVTP
jgi:alkyl sulfatase BDS1-like metallo-beta-lactamase superfamily hydrolase